MRSVPDSMTNFNPPTRRRRARLLVVGVVLLVASGALLFAGCAKYNVYYNAKRAFDQAERLREEAIREGTDVESASRSQRQNYQRAIDKAKKVLRDYPGHGLTDDALFLLGKSYQRMSSYRESVRRLDQLFTNFPATDYMEEATFLQAVNYLMLGDASRSQDLLGRLERQFPDSEFQSEALRASGDNAHALENWEDTVVAYQGFLERYPDAPNWDDSALRLAEAFWELERYEEAATVLDDVQARSNLADRVFHAGLLEARCRVRLGDTEEVERLLGWLKNDADVYTKQGEVTLVEAELLRARGDRGGAMAMLQNMPEEHLTREVRPVQYDMLGYAYLEEGDLEQAREALLQATGGGELLDDIDGTRILLKTVQDYLAADGQLPDADPPRAASLRLIQANAMLFGFDRPRAALDLYATVAADTAADSTVAARALFGARLVHGQWLDQPDSASIYDDRLQALYPDSPQAYRARSGASADLLAFLQEREEAMVAAARAEGGGTDDAAMAPATGGSLRRGSGLRRRMVYLQRRDNRRYPPPEALVLALEEERQRQAAERAAKADSLLDLAEAPVDTLTFDLLPEHLRPKVDLTEPEMPPVDLTSDGPEPADPDTALVEGEEPTTDEPVEDTKPEKRSWDL